MDGISVTPINFTEVQQAFKETPDIAARFAKTAMIRFARRVAKHTKQDYLRGRPGIVGGPWARSKDKNVRGFTIGNNLSTLQAVSRVSKIVRTHVEGATITAKAGGFLFLSRKNNIKGGGKIFARIRSVRIPARIPFEAVWRQELPRGTKEIGDALHRAVNLSLDQRMKVISQYINKVASHS